MLIGTWTVTLESDQLALPGPFRLILGDGVTLTRGFDRCLQAFPADAWHTLAHRVSALPLTADAARSLRRMIFGAAVTLPPDPRHTLAIPRHLLAYAGIGAQAVVVGCDTYFEIWSPDGWRAAAERTPTADRLSGLVAGLATPYAPAIL